MAGASDATRREQPRGREAVVTAVVAAARELFASRGYAAVSVRDIAEAAGVNHGLIHRHFGSKDAVLKAVLQGMFSEVGAVAQGPLDPASPDFVTRLFPVAATRKQDWQILMRAVLDGFDFADAGFVFPITDSVVRHVAARRGADDQETRMIAAAVIAGGLGWLLLEDYLQTALSLDETDKARLLARMADIFQTLV